MTKDGLGLWHHMHGLIVRVRLRMHGRVSKLMSLTIVVLVCHVHHLTMHGTWRERRCHCRLHMWGKGRSLVTLLLLLLSDLSKGGSPLLSQTLQYIFRFSILVELSSHSFNNFIDYALVKFLGVGRHIS